MPRTQIDKTQTLPPIREEYAVGAKVAGRYKILGMLGRGGMGVVYKAQDFRLKRIVALKFLPPELTLDKDFRKRFVREAQAAAALDHPHICTVHEIDETKGETFIVMAFIAGQSLKDKMASGPLSTQEALDISAQVAEGLFEAHAKGIVHRDIKPSNILLTEKGQAKITDFGLAKLSGRQDLTRSGTIMGTVFYMSPEQAKGENVDHRTDIWSLGVLLYEMLNGELPFKGAHDQATIYSILNNQPAPFSAFRRDIPRRVEEIVLRALEKDRTRRYQDMQEFIQGLKQERGAHAAAGALKRKLSAAEKQKADRRPSDNTRANECYLKARREIARFTEDGVQRAIKCLQDGLDADGENAVLHAGMGYAYFQYANLGIKQKENIRKTEGHARKAFQSGSESAPGHLLLGLIQQNFRGNQAQCILHLKRALALDANDPDVLYWLSNYYALVGKTYAAIPLVEKLVKLDPRHALSDIIQARLFYYEGRHGLALKAISERNKAPGEASMSRFWHAFLLSYNRRFKEAEDAVDQIAAASQQDVWTRLSILLRAALNGENKKIPLLFSQDLKLAAQRDCQVACLIAVFYAMLNDRKHALDWLEVAARRGFLNYPYLSACDPFIDNIRGDERFAKFIKRVKREWENLKV